MKERLRFEREVRDLGLDVTQRPAEIGGFWVTQDPDRISLLHYAHNTTHLYPFFTSIRKICEHRT
jgi:hypothetical protein